MQFRHLGKTDLLLSEVSLGCSGYWGESLFPETSAAAIVNEAFDRGVNFFDTGHHYSNYHAEPRLGRILKELLARTDRSRLVISSKAGSLLGRTPVFTSKGASPQDFTPETIESSCHKSIKNLHCDYLDIFQLHGVNPGQITDPLLEKLMTMKKGGCFKYLGINTHSEAMMKFVAERPEVFDLVLIDYSVAQLDRDPIVAELYQRGIGVIAGTVLAQGHVLKGKQGSLWNGSFFWYLARSLLKPASRKLAGKARRMRNALSCVGGMSPAQAAFAFILENPAVSSCVFGTTNLHNLVEVLESSGRQLSDRDRNAIRQAYQAG